MMLRGIESLIRRMSDNQEQGWDSMPIEKKVPVAALRSGMYVSRLDRPWVETPFLFQGFTLNSPKELDELKQHCEYVYIDIERGEDSQQEFHRRLGDLNREIVGLLRRPAGQQLYPVITSLEEEKAHARESLDRIQASLVAVHEDIRAGKNLSLIEARDAVDGMIQSIIRNPDSFIWLTRLKQKDGYTYKHAIDSSVLAANFGRYLGLHRDEMSELALACLLLDIGKVMLPDEMLVKPGKLTDAEFQLMKRHVQFSIDILSESRGMTRNILDTVATHHERHLGHGYPHGLSGYEIPVFGRIAAIVDCYDAITSDRPYAKALSQYDSIRKLYEWRDHDFQADMVEQFIQCLGVYPTGSLVELTTGQVGIVLMQNPVRRLKPTLMLVLDENKIAYDFQPRLDLARDGHGAQEGPVEILRALEPGSYGINPGDYYI